jgi:putative spermidine/putrescine transport system ATP-binding protein
MLRLEHLRKTFPPFTLGVERLEVGDGEILGLIGPSGSGKSTLLRLIAGLELPDQPEPGALSPQPRISLDETDLLPLPPERRGVGMVFQDYALFPHLSVWENIAFGLREAHWERDRLERRVSELLELTHLGPQAKKRPQALSGGERQRVALARALANLPGVLLLDEPLGALDRELREELLPELGEVLRRAGVLTLVVTHDQSEAFALADRVAVLRAGRIVRVDPPERLYNHPRDRWTAAFLGHKNLLGPEQSRLLGLPGRHYLLPNRALHLGTGEPATVLERLFLGSRTVLRLEWRSVLLHWEGTESEARPDQTVLLSLDLSRAVALEESPAPVAGDR